MNRRYALAAPIAAIYLGSIIPRQLRHDPLRVRPDCDTADGTFIAFGPDANLPRVLDWLDDVNHCSLFGAAS